MLKRTGLSLLQLLSALMLSFGMVGPAAAEFLDGRDLQVENLFQGSPSLGFTVAFTVDSAVVEIPDWGGASISIDVFDTGPTTASVLISQFGTRFYGPSPNLVYFTELSAGIPDFLNVVLGDASPNFNDVSRVSFNATTFSYDLGSLVGQPGDFVRLDLSTKPDVAGVPEPSSVAMLCGLGLTGVGASIVRRRRRGS